MISLKNLPAEIIQDIRSERLTPGLTLGLVVGLSEVLVSISFAALIFSGELSNFVVDGIWFALIGGIISGFVVVILTSIPGTLGGNQDAPAAILAVVSAAVVATMPGNATGYEKFATVAVIIALTTLLCGLFFLGLGYFKLGGLVRFLPYPVVGGFLAGTGWLLVIGSINMMTGNPLSISGLSGLFQSETIILWLPGLTFAVILMVVTNRYHHYLLLPGLVLGAIIVFFLFIWLAGLSIEALTEQGLLLGPLPGGNLVRPFPLSALTQVNWQLVLSQAGSISVVLAISAVSLLLNVSGLELETEEDMDINHELRAAGAGNLIAGFFAGFIGFQQLSFSVMNHRLGARTRLAGIVVVLVSVAALILGTSFISMFPKFVLGSMLMYLGLTFLFEWLYKTWFKLPKADYFVILLIVGVIASVGFLEGVVVGFLAAIVLFAINYSRVDVIKHSLRLDTYRSRMTRPKLQQRLLHRYGKQVLILELQGYIFFGTANQLLEKIRLHLEEYANTRLCFLLLDFSRVTGVDSSVVFSFRKLRQLVEKNQAGIVLTGLSPGVQTFLQNSDVLASDGAAFQVFPDMDQGLEWCEDSLLASTGVLAKESPKSFHDQLRKLTTDSALIEHIMKYLEKIELNPGTHFIHQGDSPGAVYFLENGVVTAQLEIEGEEPLRLNTLSGENLVGEIGFYLGSKRNASVVTDTATTLYRLTAESLTRMESYDPEAAALFHKFFAHAMAEKLSQLMDTVETLMR